MYKLTKTEQIFKRVTDIDKKNKLNRSELVISKDIIDEIEKGQITSEILDTLLNKDLIYKYNTQITIHGIFPLFQRYDIQQHYKNIFQNKNLSIGVRYNAIDYNRKLELFRKIKRYSDYNYHLSASELYLYQFRIVKDQNELLTIEKEFKDKASKIDTTLFNGSVNVVKGYIPYYGYACKIEIGINSIYEKDTDKVLLNIIDLTKEQIEVKEQALLEKEKQKDNERKEWEAQYALEKQAKIETLKPELEKIKSQLELKYTKLTEKDINNLKHGLYIKPVISTYDNIIKYEFVSYNKDKNIFRKITIDKLDLNDTKVKNINRTHAFNGFKIERLINAFVIS